MADDNHTKYDDNSECSGSAKIEKVREQIDDMSDEEPDTESEDDENDVNTESSESEDEEPYQPGNDEKNFDKPRNLNKHILAVRNVYKEGLLKEDFESQRIAVALYLIDYLGLRPGSLKDSKKDSKQGSQNEDTTFGCCSLKKEHVELFEDPEQGKFHVKLDFLAKCRIQCRKNVAIDEKVYVLLKIFKNIPDSDYLFGNLKSSDLNVYLKQLQDLKDANGASLKLEGITCRVFRTRLACLKFQEKLEELTKKRMKPKTCFVNAVKYVSVLLNHIRRKDCHNSGYDSVSDLKESPETAHITEEKMKTTSDQSTKKSYVDPRIIYAWCKRNNVIFEDLLRKDAKKLIAMWRWASEINDDYKF